MTMEQDFAKVTAYITKTNQIFGDVIRSFGCIAANDRCLDPRLEAREMLAYMYREIVELDKTLK